MCASRFVLSQEKCESTSLVALSGFIYSCRNLGHVTFFLVEDPEGLVQVLWEKSVLDTKLSDLLSGKRIDILGYVRKREHLSTSLTKVNNDIEIYAEDCFLLDQEGRSYSILNEASEILSQIRAGKLSFVEKSKEFEITLSDAKIMLIIRDWMRDNGYWETSFEDLLGRNFHFVTNPNLEEVILRGPFASEKELLSKGEELCRLIFSFYGLELPASIDILPRQQCIRLYSTEKPDLRYSYPIEAPDSYLDLGKLDSFFQNGRCIVIPGLDKCLAHIEKIVEFVKKQIGLSIYYLIRRGGAIAGPLSEFAINGEFDDHVIFFSPGRHLNEVEQALSLVFAYLKENSLCSLEIQSTKWIRNGDAEGSQYSLLLNGEPVCKLDFMNFGSIFSNRGSINLNFYFFKNKDRLLRKDNSIQNRKSHPPPTRFSTLITYDELLDAIHENELFEQEQVIELLNLPCKQRSFQEKIDSIGPILIQFSMKKEDGNFLISLLPSKIESVQKYSEQECFRFLWSLLGHKHVLEVLHSDRGRDVLNKICSMNIINDYKQFLFIDLKTIFLIEDWMSDSKIPENLKIKILKTLLNAAPNDFSNLMECLHLLNQNNILLDEKVIGFLLRGSRMGFSTPHLFSLYRKHYKQPEILYEIQAFFKMISYSIFQNLEFNNSKIANQSSCFFIKEDLDEEELMNEIIYFLFKPINMSFFNFINIYQKVQDRTSDIVNRLVFSGQHWDLIKECYSFAREKYSLDIYPSKNRASFFAKASAGICTGIDLELFQRREHFHLNLVSPEGRNVIGNVQAYLLQNNSTKSLLIRGINPSTSFLDEHNYEFILNSVLESAVQIAKSNEFDQVLLCPSLGIWHVESSRNEIIGAMRILCEGLPKVTFESPFLLFKFASQSKEISFAYLLWDGSKDQKRDKINAENSESFSFSAEQKGS